MKNIFKVKIHILFYIFALVSVLTGMFREFVIFTSIIIIHEFGHILGALCFKIYPKQINILPFGGLTIFNMKINTSINKELVIALSGPVFQIIIFYLLKNKIINPVFSLYNYFLLIFNLMPIYPLDGSKILNCIFNKITNLKKSFYITIYLSLIFVSIFLLIIFFKHLSFGWILILLFLVIKVIDELKNFNLIFNKFLWERYNYKFHFKREKLIKSVNQMKKDYQHIFKQNNLLLNEEEILRKRFDFNRKL